MELEVASLRRTGAGAPQFAAHIFVSQATFWAEVTGAGTKWAFKMNYVSYILGILGIGLLCLVSIHIATRDKSSVSKSRFTPKREDHGNATETELNTRRILKRELRQTPAPWGWAHHQQIKHGDYTPAGVWAAMTAFIGRLTRRKELVCRTSGNPHISASFRALLEDRYAPLNHKPITSVRYQKVKRPLLRDPVAPHDQMDNFGSREAEPVRQKLQRARAMSTRHDDVTRKTGYPETDLTKLKQPWGW